MSSPTDKVPCLGCLCRQESKYVPSMLPMAEAASLCIVKEWVTICVYSVEQQKTRKNDTDRCLLAV